MVTWSHDFAAIGNSIWPRYFSAPYVLWRTFPFKMNLSYESFDYHAIGIFKISHELDFTDISDVCSRLVKNQTTLIVGDNSFATLEWY